MTAERTAEFFDRYARDFNAIYGNKNTLFNSVVNALFRQSMKRRYELTLQGCAPIEGRSVLDIGCGPGHYSIELARRGAKRVLGIDFADGMLDLARRAAAAAGVQDVCSFENADFFKRDFDARFDYVIVMGFMDYVADPRSLIRKAVQLTASRAFFSFPLDDGLLAWQRRLRYRSRCDLFMYTEPRVRALFAEVANTRFDVQRIHRDLFVTVSVN
jgi:2-polyprenyl-3-methyl-5-hydroxy-6-metoxy-1,4-benzoquinol methylase